MSNKTNYQILTSKATCTFLFLWHSGEDILEVKTDIQVTGNTLLEVAIEVYLFHVF